MDTLESTVNVPHSHPQQERKVSNHMDEQVLPRDISRPRTWLVVVVAVIFLLLLGGLFAVGWFPRHQTDEQTRADANARASDVEIVSVAHPVLASNIGDIILPCDVRPFRETNIYARANGYLTQFDVDIQDKVKANQQLAIIASPEVDDQLEQSKAALASAEAKVGKAQSDLNFAERTLARYNETNQQRVVGPQELDEKKDARDQAKNALLQAQSNVVLAKTEVRRLTTLKEFEIVSAPFDGTITARNYDIGALLTSGNTTPGRELFRITQTDVMRVFVNVPQIAATSVKIGQAAFLTVRNYPSRQFQGQVARTASAVEVSSRTMLVEIDFKNSDGALLSGMYGQVKLSAQDAAPALVVPTSALVFNAAGLQVAVVRDGKVHFQMVSIGRDLGTQVEVTIGLSPDDQIVINPSERLAEGIPIHTRLPASEQKIPSTQTAGN